MEVTAYQIWETIGIWFTGLATFAAVAFALYLRHSYEKRQKPDLDLIYDSESESHKHYLEPKHTKTYKSDGSPAEEREELWIRVCVKNSGKVTAKEVEIRFISIQRVGEQSEADRPSWWFKVANLNNIKIAVPQGYKQFFDIAYIKNSINIDNDLSFYLAIVPADLLPWKEEKARIEDDDRYNCLDIGWEYRMALCLASSNAEAKYFEMKLKVNPRTKTDPSKDALLGSEGLRKRVHIVSLNPCEP